MVIIEQLEVLWVHQVLTNFKSYFNNFQYVIMCGTWLARILAVSLLTEAFHLPASITINLLKVLFFYAVSECLS